MPKKIGNGGYLYEPTEYLTIPDTSIEWNCVGMVPATGKALIIGLPKTGKTIFAIQLALAIAKGESVFDYPTERAKVLYVVLERHRDFKRKLREISGGTIPPNLEVFEYRKPLILDSPKSESVEILRQAIKESKPDVTFVDSKYNTTSKKESDEEATGIWRGRVDKLIQDNSTSFVVVHHSPKYEYEDLVSRSAGTSVMSRWADVVIGIRRIKGKPRKDPKRILEFVSNSGDEPDDIEVEITDKGLEDISGQVQQNKVYDAVTALQEDLKRNPNMGITNRVKQVSEQTNFSIRTVWKAWNLIN